MPCWELEPKTGEGERLVKLNIQGRAVSTHCTDEIELETKVGRDTQRQSGAPLNPTLSGGPEPSTKAFLGSLTSFCLFNDFRVLRILCIIHLDFSSRIELNPFNCLAVGCLISRSAWSPQPGLPIKSSFQGSVPW